MHGIPRIGLILAVPALLYAAPGAAQEAADIARGARVYSDNCGRCHNPRPATERTDAEWVSIVAHMRVRATLSRSDARAVLAFLQATNLREGPATAAAPASSTGPAAVTPAPGEISPPEPPPAALDPSAANPILAFRLRALGVPPVGVEAPALTAPEQEAVLRYLERLARMSARER